MTTDAERAARERLAREARETATTLLDWVGTRVEGTRVEDAGRPRQSPGPCSWCPVCALVAALRGEQPELTANLAEQASGLLVLLRMLVAAHASGSHDHHAPPPPASPSPTPPSPTPAEPDVTPAPAATDETPTPPRGWPAEWGAPTWQTDVPWDVAPHATFDPAPPLRPATGRETGAGDPERPTGRRGPRPSPRHTAGAATAAPEAPSAPRPPEPAVVNGAVNGTAARTPDGGGRNAATGTRRGVQRIAVRRRPRPC